jgi:hypothetical protein
MRTTALARIAVGVTVERRKARSSWADFLWRPVSVFTGSPSATPWTPLGMEAETTLFYAEGRDRTASHGDVQLSRQSRIGRACAVDRSASDSFRAAIRTCNCYSRSRRGRRIHRRRQQSG